MKQEGSDVVGHTPTMLRPSFVQPGHGYDPLTARDGGGEMELGAFSVSLAVRDLDASRRFYESLGFEVVMGDASESWLILRNGNTTIGLFQGLFDRNALTFNPGWAQDAKPLTRFTDVRELQRELKARGVPIEQEADESSTGPASFIIVDPDGNPIYVDQHV
jgi:catechol 2,3-dioxygenase-like lactoylglutathione lyase family enzyme